MVRIAVLLLARATPARWGPVTVSRRSFQTSAITPKIWDLFRGKKAEEQPQPPAKSSSEPNASTPTLTEAVLNAPLSEQIPADAAALENTKASDDVALPKPLDPAHVERVVRQAVEAAHPNHTGDWAQISFASSGVKYSVLVQCMEALARDVPNCNLNNITNAQQLVDFFQGKVDVVHLQKVHAVAKYFGERQTQLPPNMTFVPYQPRQRSPFNVDAQVP
ncbi:hypothetical protein H4R34_004664 [Dimargaris verticillata]|uniref:Uncharacterized protein n=1 Tax=Dimargaris verticillata TaxID=2761393 RepID=A0A9W8B3V8_9FUNG|nr:hypothetical protein H4R34_004664 [Dimargaris verticillata]